MFRRLGRKIIRDAQQVQLHSVNITDDNDDSFQRYTGKCQEANDVYYHGGHSHSHDDGLTDD